MAEESTMQMEPGRFEQLMESLNSTDIQTRCTAIEALGELGDPRAVEPLCGLLPRFSFDPKTKQAIIVALGKLKDARAVDALLPFLGYLNLEKPTRLSLVATLGELGDQRAIEPLKATLSIDDPEVYHATVQALQRLGASTAAIAEAHLDAEERQKRERLSSPFRPVDHGRDYKRWRISPGKLIALGLVLSVITAVAWVAFLSPSPGHTSSPFFNRHGLPGDVPLPTGATYFGQVSTSSPAIGAPDITVTLATWYWTVPSPQDPISVSQFYQDHLPSSGWKIKKNEDGSMFSACQGNQFMTVGIGTHVNAKTDQGKDAVLDAPAGGSVISFFIDSSSDPNAQPLLCVNF